MKKKPQGFAAMNIQRRKEIAALGGKASGGNFKNDPARASRSGKKGGTNSWQDKRKKIT